MVSKSTTRVVRDIHWESVKTDEPTRNDSFIPGLPFHLFRSPSSFPTMVCITTFFVCSSPRGSLRFLPFLRGHALCRSVKRLGQSVHRLYDGTRNTFSDRMKTQSYESFIGFNSNSDFILTRECERDWKVGRKLCLFFRHLLIKFVRLKDVIMAMWNMWDMFFFKYK